MDTLNYTNVRIHKDHGPDASHRRVARFPDWSPWACLSVNISLLLAGGPDKPEDMCNGYLPTPPSLVTDIDRRLWLLGIYFTIADECVKQLGKRPKMCSAIIRRHWSPSEAVTWTG